MFYKTVYLILCIASLVMESQQDDANSWGNDNRSYCIVPMHRTPNIYYIDGISDHNSGWAYNSFYITVSCQPGYHLIGKKVTRCVDGVYAEPLGSCYTNIDDGGKSNDTGELRPYCEVPDHPRHGSYSFRGKAHPEIPGAYQEINLTFKCNHGYELQGESYASCAQGKWYNDLPKCVSKYGYLADPLEKGLYRSPIHCKPPEKPKHGSYVIEGDPDIFINDVYPLFYISVTCNDGHEIYGEDFVRCQGGKWSAEMPICGIPCYLKKDASVDYMCEGKGNVLEKCGDYVKPFEIVTPRCNDNVTRDDATVMRCGENGNFDHVVTCGKEDAAIECGLVTVSDGLIIGGLRVEHGEVPWHAGVYDKGAEPFMQICGGTIVTTTTIVSAAHCFWGSDGKQKPASKYAVAAGKIYRPWNDPHDIYAQKSDVLEVKIPNLFFGSIANYQNDIAVLKLATAIQFNRFVRPICLDFTEDADKYYQVDGLMKVAGWGLKSADGDPSQTLKAVFLPIVDLDKCINESPFAFKPYITQDKICAGYQNGTAVCKGDSGGGLTYHRTENGVFRHYLKGVVSTAPNYGLEQCNAFTWATFTSVIKHRGFVYSNVKQ